MAKPARCTEVRYRTKREAVDTAKVRKAKAVNRFARQCKDHPYSCLHCGCWHLTTQPK
jgi:hypothetical protein